mgnify:FL=1
MPRLQSENAESLVPWLVLATAPGIGPRTLRRLLECFGTPRAVLDASADRLLAAGLGAEILASLRQPDQSAISAVLDWAGRPDAHILTLLDPRYPSQLAEIPDPPPLLFVRGDPLLLAAPQVAIVGSRNPTPNGQETTREFAAQLARSGLVVTSGLALGVDGAAHEGALTQGRTIAVLGTGPDRVYPAVHRQLARLIAETGVLVSEFLPGQGPLAHHFPRRNRIISGLSLGVLVTEAAVGSGSLITARCALEQGREVFAVPGSVRNPLSRGCHALIREGARLVESADDVLLELAPQLRAMLDESAAVASPPDPGLEPEQQGLLAAMGFDPLAADDLVARTGLPTQQVLSMLSFLELSGHVSSLPGGRYCRARVE